MQPMRWMAEHIDDLAAYLSAAMTDRPSVKETRNHGYAWNDASVLVRCPVYSRPSFPLLAHSTGRARPCLLTCEQHLPTKKTEAADGFA